MYHKEQYKILRCLKLTVYILLYITQHSTVSDHGLCHTQHCQILHYITQHSSIFYAVSHRTLSDPALYLIAQYQILRVSHRTVSDPALYHTLRYHILRYMTEHSIRCTVSHRTVSDPVLYHMAQYQILCCITQQSIIFLFCISSLSIRGGIDDGCFCSVGSTIKVDFRGRSSRESTLMEFIGNIYPPPPTFITNFS